MNWSPDPAFETALSPRDDAQTALAALTGRVSLLAVTPSWFVFSEGFHRSRWNEVVKRSLDLAVAMVGMVAAIPLMVLVAIAVGLEKRSQVVRILSRVRQPVTRIVVLGDTHGNQIKVRKPRRRVATDFTGLLDGFHATNVQRGDLDRVLTR